MLSSKRVVILLDPGGKIEDVITNYPSRHIFWVIFTHALDGLP
jgi:hypothetical protein